jgi:hypothetical protein
MSKRRVIRLHGDSPRPAEPPSSEPASEIAERLSQSLEVLRKLVQERIRSYLERRDGRKSAAMRAAAEPSVEEQALPELIPGIDDRDERLLLILALVPHLEPDFFESLVLESLPGGGDFPIFGGVKNGSHRGLLPTGETAQFVLAGFDLAARLAVCRLFEEEHAFGRQGILWLEPVKEGEPTLSGRILVAREWVDRLLLGKVAAPRFGLDFPARRIVTQMQWEDAVLHTQTRKQVEELTLWLAHRQRLSADENLGRKIKPGYRVLFYGPSGTGKTLTAALLGKRFEREVYRIDLSQVVSKYIGETEKNLEAVFRRAETKDWVLFFDEADALFGKRTNVQSAHDKYANQEVSYLLQRVEDFPGLLILASNYKNNLDDAFLRRFHSLIHFPMPGPADRLTLWRKSLPAGLTPADDVDLPALAKTYELSGASILNAVQFAALQAYARYDDTLLGSDLVEGIRKEFMKEEKSI